VEGKFPKGEAWPESIENIESAVVVRPWRPSLYTEARRCCWWEFEAWEVEAKGVTGSGAS